MSRKEKVQEQFDAAIKEKAIPDGFIKVTDNPVDGLTSEQKVILNRKANAMFNAGNIEDARRIYITTGYGDGWYFDTDKPLFDYVTDSVTINYANADHNTEPVPIEIRRKYVDSTTMVALRPLFANYVKAGDGDPATWKIKAAPYDDSKENQTHPYLYRVSLVRLLDVKLKYFFPTDF